MAFRFDAAADRLERSTDLPLGSSFTLMAWAYVTAYQGGFSAFFCLGPSQILELSSSGVLDTWSGGSLTTGSTLATERWYHLTLIGDGAEGAANSLRAYVNGVLDISGGRSSGTTNTPLQVGSETNFNEWLNGRLAAVKVWNRALSVQEIRAEMQQYVPVSRHALNTFTPGLTHSDVRNVGGTAPGVWTVGGTLATEPGPPIPWQVTPARAGYRLATVAGTADTWTAPVCGTLALGQQIRAIRTLALRAQYFIDNVSDSSGPLPTQPDTWPQPTQPILGTRGVTARAAARQMAFRALAFIDNPSDQDGPLPVQPSTWVQPIPGTRALGDGSRLYTARATRESWLWTTAQDVDGDTPIQPDTYVQPVPGTAALGGHARRFLACVTSTARFRWWGDFNDGPLGVQPDTWTAPTAIGVSAWLVARLRSKRLPVPSFSESSTVVVPPEPDTWMQQPVPGTRALHELQRAWWARAARPQPYGEFSDGPIGVQPATWTTPVAAGLSAWVARRLSTRTRAVPPSGDVTDSPVTPEPDTWQQQPIPGTRSLRETTRTYWQRAARIWPWGDTTTLSAVPEPDTWQQQPIAGTRSLRETTRGYWQRAARVWPWGDTTTVSAVPEPDTWQQQPIAGTRALRDTQRAWWARAAKVWPWGDFTDGPLPAQPDTYTQPVPGVARLRSGVLELRRRGQILWQDYLRGIAPPVSPLGNAIAEYTILVSADVDTVRVSADVDTIVASADADTVRMP